VRYCVSRRGPFAEPSTETALIYQLLERLAAEGKAVIAISSELPEIIRISDRVLVRDASWRRAMICDSKERSELSNN
jgi:ribose transport system ATP-binding protein